MKGLIYLFSGLVFVIVGTFVYFTINASGASSAAAGFGIDLGGTLLLPSLISWLVGGGLVLLGVISLMGDRKRQSELQHINTHGIETMAVITYLDRNYSLLLNNRPVYSILEYRYRDAMGREFVERVDNIKTDTVIRSGWQVGSTIRVRYLADNPAKSGIMIPQAAY